MLDLKIDGIDEIFWTSGITSAFFKLTTLMKELHLILLSNL